MQHFGAEFSICDLIRHFSKAATCWFPIVQVTALTLSRFHIKQVL